MSLTGSKMKLSHIVFVVSVFTFLYWIIALNTNVNAYTFTSIVFKVTSFILMVLLYAIPLFIIALIIRLKQRTPKLHYISLALLLVLLLVFFTVYQ